MTNKTAGAFGPAAIAIAVMLGAARPCPGRGADAGVGFVNGRGDRRQRMTMPAIPVRPMGDWELVCMRAEEG